MVDISGDNVSPLLEECRHCGEPLDAESIVDVPAVEAGAGGARPVPTCENCGTRLSDDALDAQGEDLDGCRSCEPDADESPAAGE